ncbi:MAG: hypothetical protein BroJett011_31280 [Chloroflexota bacterium]|nr:MAG: hypothetical protein BroJett011_31280 [Chloroflexota bacterium]
MTILTLELSAELYEDLRLESERRGESMQILAQKLLAERLASPALERERAIAALRSAGLLAELSPEEKQRASQSTATLEEVRAALDRAGGKPLSELILEMRGPKE